VAVFFKSNEINENECIERFVQFHFCLLEGAKISNTIVIRSSF